MKREKKDRDKLWDKEVFLTSKEEEDEATVFWKK